MWKMPSLQSTGNESEKGQRDCLKLNCSVLGYGGEMTKTMYTLVNK
jgi:hypothetical protein